jgi:hypothetical protein
MLSPRPACPRRFPGCEPFLWLLHRRTAGQPIAKHNIEQRQMHLMFSAFIVAEDARSGQDGEEHRFGLLC